MKKRAVILGCIFSASILLSGSHILSLLNDTAKKETKTVSTYQTASQEEAETDSNDSEKEDFSKSSKEQSILDQIRFVDIFYGSRILSNRRRQRIQPGRAACKLLNERQQNVSVDVIQTIFVHLQKI